MNHHTPHLSSKTILRQRVILQRPPNKYPRGMNRPVHGGLHVHNHHAMTQHRQLSGCRQSGEPGSHDQHIAIGLEAHGTAY
jgi:hypothetical protein